MIRVLCPTYNRPEKLKRAIASFLEQKTTVEKRLIIIDNGSEPKVEIDAHTEIELIRYEQNIRPFIAISNAFIPGHITTLLFDDDMFFDETSLQTRCQPILDGGADCTHSDAMEFGDRKRVYIPGDVDYNRIIRSDCIYLGTMAWNDTVWQRVWPLDVSLILQIDWLFKIKAVKYCRVKYIEETTYIAEIHADTESVKFKHLKETETARIKEIIKTL